MREQSTVEHRSLLPVHLALVLVQLMFASLSVAGKLVLRELPPFGLIAFRAPAAALLLLAIRALRPWERVAWRDVPQLAVQAFFGIVANQLLFIMGLERSTATNAVVIGATIPVFTVGVAVALDEERATPAKLAGLAIAFAGAMVIVGGGHFQASGRVLVGNLLILANSLSFSIYLVISRPMLKRYRTLTVVTWVMGLGALGVLPFGAGTLVQHAPTLSTGAWVGLVYIALFPTVGTYFLNAFSLKRAPSSLVAIYVYAQPLLGAAMAAVLLDERPTVFIGLGGLFIGIGIFLVNRAALTSKA